MKIKIFQPLAIHQVGKRENNEDSVYPLIGKATANDKLFLVCDGVGGAAKGEVASQLAMQSFAEFFIKNAVEVSDETVINQALDFVQDKFDAYIGANPTAKGMACTLTLLHLHEGGASIAHAGDSRVYHIRKGKIQWQTEDHKMVMEMLKAGVLTPEQAANHPQSNVISRAIQGKIVKPIKADFKLIDSIEPNDSFFMCTDGVLESISDDLLEDIIGNAESNEEKIKLIQQICEGQSSDNFSAYFIKIKAIDEVEVLEKEEIIIDIDDTQDNFLPVQNTAQQTKKKVPKATKTDFKLTENKSFTKIPMFKVLLAISVLILGFIIYRKFFTDEKELLPQLQSIFSSKK